MLRMQQRRRLGISARDVFAHVRVAKQIQPLRVCSHHSVLNPVMHHFDEVSGTAGAAVKIAQRSGFQPGAVSALSRGRGRIDPWREGREDGIKMSHDARLTTDHLTETSLQAPYTATGPYVHIVEIMVGEFAGTPNVVLEIRITPIDHDVPSVQQWNKFRNRRVDNRCG